MIHPMQPEITFIGLINNRNSFIDSRFCTEKRKLRAMKDKKWVPLTLTTLRLLLGPVALFCTYAHLSRIWFLPILIGGFLSDIFDGVLARRFGVSTPGLRRYDSITDVLYYLCILISVWLVAPTLIAANWGWVAAVLVTQAVDIGMCLLKFRCFPATHSLLAKIFGLALFIGLTSILAAGFSIGMLPTLGIIGVTANVEILLILILARKPPVDVLSVFHLPRLRQQSAPLWRDAGRSQRVENPRT